MVTAMPKKQHPKMSNPRVQLESTAIGGGGGGGSRTTVFDVGDQNEMQDLYALAPILREGRVHSRKVRSRDFNRDRVEVRPLQLHLEQSHDFKAREDVGVIRG